MPGVIVPRGSFFSRQSHRSSWSGLSGSCIVDEGDRITDAPCTGRHDVGAAYHSARTLARNLLRRGTGAKISGRSERTVTPSGVTKYFPGISLLDPFFLNASAEISKRNPYLPDYFVNTETVGASTEFSALYSIFPSSMKCTRSSN